LDRCAEEYFIEWLKDAYDYERLHSFEEIERFLSLKPEEVLQWLEEVIPFVWELKREEFRRLKNKTEGG